MDYGSAAGNRLDGHYPAAATEYLSIVDARRLVHGDAVHVPVYILRLRLQLVAVAAATRGVGTAQQP